MGVPHVLSDRGVRKHRGAVPIAVPDEGSADAPIAPDGLKFACTPLARLRGLGVLGGWGGVLVLAPCADVHTCFISRSIDIAFVSSCGVVLETCRAVPPWRRRRCRGAAFVLERWAEPEKTWYEQGQTLILAPCRVAAVRRATAVNGAVTLEDERVA